MKICSKCNVSQDEKEYYTYYHSTHKKFYTRHICFTCLRKQSKQYKLKLKEQKKLLEQIPQQEEIIQPVVQELEIKVLEGQRRCTNCKKVKDIKTEFYVKRHQCISCVREYELTIRRKKDEQYKMENGGSERVPQKPNNYADEYQKGQVTEFLTLLGWKFNSNGVWSKEGFKTKDKVWEKPINKFKKIATKNQNGNERSPVYHKRLELIELKQNGMTYQKIADIYDISPATVMRIIRDDYAK
jgi:hypothetical protein